jgi:hypothetical protein
VHLYGFGGKDIYEADQNVSGIVIRFHKGENKNKLFKKDD